MASSRRLPAAERRQQLLRVALDVFGNTGYHASSMESVASKAGVTKPVLYQHFSSKHELFGEVVRTASAELRSSVEKALSEATSPRQKVEFGFTAAVDLLASNESISRVLFDETARADGAVASDLIAVEHILASGIAEELDGLEDVDDDVRLLLAHAIVGMIESTFRHWFNNDYNIEPADLAANLASLAWSGLRGQ